MGINSELQNNKLYNTEIFAVYVEFGTTSTDSVTLTNTWGTGGLATAKKYNILATYK